MKKIVLYILLLFFTSSFTFAISDITLHMDGDDIVIRKNKIYVENEKIGEINNDNKLILYDDEEIISTVTEDDNFIYIFSNNEIDGETEIRFSKKTGNPVYARFGLESETLDEKTGLRLSKTDVFDNEYSTTEYFYNDNEIVIKEILTQGQFSENNFENKIIDNITISEYNNDGIQTHETYYNGENKIISETEYDNDGQRTKEINYNDNKEIIYEVLFKTTKSKDNITTNEEFQRRKYNKKTQQYETWEKVFFDEDGQIKFENNIYLYKPYPYYSTIEKSIDKIIKWDNNTFAKIKKINFNNSIPEFKFLENLKKQKKYIGKQFALRNDNTKKYYYFDYDYDNYEIDYNSCLEIQLIEKKDFNYSDLNLSGKQSGPFGFDIGMTYDEVKAACNGEEPQHIGDDRYYVKPIKSHPSFDRYIVWISPKYGLYYIKGIGSFISTNDNGKNIKSKYSTLLYTLEKKYGKYFGVDFVNENYKWNEDSNWLEKLKNNEKTYHSYFYPAFENFDGLYSVIVGIDTTDKYTITDAYIFIEYEFLNRKPADELIDDVL